MISGTSYLWFKALHVAFMVTWFAGLFYLPRLFIYHSEASNADDKARFTVMERRLFIIMSIGAGLTALFGVALLLINSALLAIGCAWVLLQRHVVGFSFKLFGEAPRAARFSK